MNYADKRRILFYLGVAPNITFSGYRLNVVKFNMELAFSVNCQDGKKKYIKTNKQSEKVNVTQFSDASFVWLFAQYKPFGQNTKRTQEKIKKKKEKKRK